MNILVLDAGFGPAGAAIARTGSPLLSERLEGTLTSSSSGLALLVHRLLEKAELTPDRLDRIGLTAGPGSFTGLRVALGLAKGLAFSRGTPLALLSTLSLHAAMYHGAPQALSKVAVVLDARRGEVHGALFDCAAPIPRTLWPARLWHPHPLGEALSAFAATEGQLAVVGDGSPLLGEGDPLPGLIFPLQQPWVDLDRLARLTALLPDDELLSPWDPCEPLYLRPPQITLAAAK
ncbi:MAG: tRNA (adenosine(37)-N6)-threonylcarbamoyltransferase complex dimerization subunit type 1 TsaB [Magnetococcales bacterium]|nr:tRNA (adenosine(37)-N6)-threonylcarbamoyltransferase complex dimerization subunit type 1 TsaB [Magnetococcales bacterium]